MKPKKQKTMIQEYFFAFDVVKQYPYTRSYTIKRPMKKSLKDSVMGLFVSQM